MFGRPWMKIEVKKDKEEKKQFLYTILENKSTIK